MIVRTFGETTGTGRDIVEKDWRSICLLLEQDGMGFSLHDASIKAGTETTIWHKSYLEAVYCIRGEGEIELTDGTTHLIAPGTLYALDKHEKHWVRAFKDMRLICICNPPRSVEEENEGPYSLPY